ncbi:hypothetical protein tinsulaeT_35740 [Thalassotalea insulae]|uniref:Lcl C-terminal domain-containing protein n=1 Tax=Thalassotalea insulae TaxID=2056778 RepID=A0ABQ6GX40_9GAMM|nr:DUF1566 domain-containing protein [Thalassotalea insulae]GLX80234.1 hypothetical protein tinsulaeT_35740 [Thalassotalea insulae]
MYKSFISKFLLITLIFHSVISCGGSGESSTPPATINQAPLSSAGEDQEVFEHVQVTLSGSGSDSDGSISKYEWKQVSGTEVELSGLETKNSTFTAPQVEDTITLSFQLTVTDNEGKSSKDAVDVVVKNNTSPIASAQGTIFLKSGEMAELRANSSNDLESTLLKYEWSQIDNSNLIIELSEPNLEVITFNVPHVDVATIITFELMVIDEGGLYDSEKISVAISPQISEKLNDTGVLLCGSTGANNNESCESELGENGENIPDGQDADFGRDNHSNFDLDGHAGFSFTKVSEKGTPLPVESTEWTCVLDNVTGLMWEVKSSDGGLRDKFNTYSFYDPMYSGVNKGTKNGGTCTGNSCDTSSFVSEVNEVGLCGHNDWRLPTRMELISIVDYSSGQSELTIDTNFFPNTQIFSFETLTSSYISATRYPKDISWIFYVSYENGFSGSGYFHSGYYSRLVRTVSE